MSPDYQISTINQSGAKVDVKVNFKNEGGRGSSAVEHRTDLGILKKTANTQGFLHPQGAMGRQGLANSQILEANYPSLVHAAHAVLTYLLSKYTLMLHRKA